MDKREIIDTVKQFQEKVETLGRRPLKTILYNSCAEDTQEQSSDIDIVVVSNDFTGKSYWERIEILAEAIYEIFAPIEALPLTDEEWEQGDSIIIQFARNGQILFAA